MRGSVFMEELIKDLFRNITAGIGITDILDVLIVAFLAYKVLGFIRETRAEQLAKGILVFFLATFGSYVFNLYTLHYILSNMLQVGLIALVVIFQPELRRALEQLGRKNFLSYQTKTT